MMPDQLLTFISRAAGLFDERVKFWPIVNINHVLVSCMLVHSLLADTFLLHSL